MDLFNNCDLVVVDLSNSDHRPFLSFELGMRETLSGDSQSPSIVLFEDDGEDS